MDLNRAMAPSSKDEEKTIQASIVDMFRYHGWDAEKGRQDANVGESLKAAVATIIANVPPCPDRSAAIRKVREARMDCNSAIRYDGRY
jgi:hypothetical protein